jgi:hypothetical protein
MKRRFIKYVGFEYELKNRSLIVRQINMTKENLKFTEVELRGFIKATYNYYDSLIKNKNLSDLFGELFLQDVKNDVEALTFYKYISKDTYNNFISKGKFRLGSLKLYSEIENKKIRDVKEGFSNIIIDSGTRQIVVSVISGFNFYIQCGTYNLDASDFMSKNFGSYVIKIKNIKSYANKVQKAIGAKNWYIKKVLYSDYKAYRIERNISNLSGVGPDLSNEMFDILYDASFIPSIFCKPTFFNKEQELRLVFEMEKNVKKELNFNQLGLLDEIEILKTTTN